ncbi:hypothetical protein BP00DRAFT_480012, partial [Aspergillus indologenus CBS 114.80]
MTMYRLGEKGLSSSSTMPQSLCSNSFFQPLRLRKIVGLIRVHLANEGVIIRLFRAVVLRIIVEFTDPVGQSRLRLIICVGLSRGVNIELSLPAFTLDDRPIGSSVIPAGNCFLPLQLHGIASKLPADAHPVVANCPMVEKDINDSRMSSPDSSIISHAPLGVIEIRSRTPGATRPVDIKARLGRHGGGGDVVECVGSLFEGAVVKMN